MNNHKKVTKNYHLIDKIFSTKKIYEHILITNENIYK